MITLIHCEVSWISKHFETLWYTHRNPDMKKSTTCTRSHIKQGTPKTNIKMQKKKKLRVSPDSFFFPHTTMYSTISVLGFAAAAKTNEPSRFVSTVGNVLILKPYSTGWSTAKFTVMIQSKVQLMKLKNEVHNRSIWQETGNTVSLSAHLA